MKSIIPFNLKPVQKTGKNVEELPFRRKLIWTITQFNYTQKQNAYLSFVSRIKQRNALCPTTDSFHNPFNPIRFDR
jgi:hypothetical protein